MIVQIESVTLSEIIENLDKAPKRVKEILQNMELIDDRELENLVAKNIKVITV